MPVPNNLDDLLELIQEKLFDNTSGKINESTMREVMNAISIFLDTKMSLALPTLPENYLQLFQRILDFKESQFFGKIALDSVFPSDIDLWGLMGEGTYANAGGLTIAADKVGFVSRKNNIWQKVEIELPGVSLASEFNKDNNSDAVSGKSVSEYIGDFPETKNGEETLIDLTAAAWVNGKYVNSLGVITDHPNTRYMAIPISAGDSIVTNLAIVNDAATNIFVSESGQCVAGYKEATNNVYSFAEFFIENGIYYINQNLDVTTVNYINKYHVPTEEVDLVGFIEDKFKVVKNGSFDNLGLIVGRKGVFYNLNAATVGTSKYSEHAYFHLDYDTSRFYKVKAGEKYYLTAWVGYNGVALFDENRVLTHKLLYSPTIATQVTEAEIIIPADGYMNIGFDRTKPHTLKKLSSTVETVTVQELYDGSQGGELYIGRYLNLTKPAGLWKLMCSGTMPVDNDDKQLFTVDIVENNKSVLKCLAEVSWQGQSSLTYPKKNFTFDFLNSEGDSLELKIGHMVATDSFHLKGFQKEISFIRDHLASNLWHQIRKADTFPNNRIANLPNDISNAISDKNYYEEDARFFADGFPCEMYVNNGFQGIYIFRLKKSRQNYKLDNTKKSNIFLEFDYTINTSAGIQLLKWNTFDPSQFELKSPKISGYVAGGVITDTTVMNSINGLWAWTTAVYNNSGYAAQETKVMLSAWIDYMIACEVANHWDGWNNNILLMTHDGIRWSPFIYDTDHTFGMQHPVTAPLRSTKTDFILNQDARADGNAENKIFWKNFRTIYNAQIRARYTELRKLGIISIQNVEKTALNFITPLGRESYKKEQAKWGYGTDVAIGRGNLRQILEMANASINYLDSQWLNP